MLTKDLIIELEERLIEAMKNSNIQELDALLADDVIFTAHTGSIHTKEEDMDAHRSGNIDIFDIKIDDQVIKVLDDVAIVSVLLEISGSFFGNTEVGFFRFTRFWKLVNNEWQVVAAHSTQVVS